MMDISVRVEIFKEGDAYVALSPELNVSSFGETVDEAKKSLKEAVGAFIEEWESRKPIIEENLALAV